MDTIGIRQQEETTMLLVQKFGGSSLADLERLRRAAGIVLRAQREGGKKRGSRYPGGRREQIYHFISPF